MTSPIIPTVFFNNPDALITVSAASVNILPTTGMKFPVTNLAVFTAMPSATAVAVPCTDNTPKKIVKKIPIIPTLTFCRSLDNFVTLY
ncbi:Uncharacterised protein [Streptococcus pneumoniae]|nr:Uncharacterised protein [Streptococcus pneumoniae]